MPDGDAPDWRTETAGGLPETVGEATGQAKAMNRQCSVQRPDLGGTAPSTGPLGVYLASQSWTNVPSVPSQ